MDTHRNLIHLFIAFVAFIALAACNGNSSTDAADGGMDAAMHDVVDASVDRTVEAGPAVGITTRTFVDDTRATPANGDAGALPNRTLVTDILYPAQGTGTDPVADAPLDAAHAPYPLVVFVHGSDGNRENSRSLLVALARAGYVVAAANFPLTAIDTPGGASDLHADDQVGDVSFLADQLAAAAMNASDALANAIDPGAGYGVLGHSTGGTVTLLALYATDIHDTRVRAGVALAPCACFFANTFFQGSTLPLLVIAGTDDRFVPISTNGARAYMLSQAPHAMVTLVGGNHIYFTDLDFADDLLMPMPTTEDADLALTLARYGGGNACTPIPPPGTDPAMSFDMQHLETQRWVPAFFDATLRGDPSALMRLEATTDPAVQLAHDGI